MTLHSGSVRTPGKQQAEGSGRVGRIKVLDKSGRRMMEGVAGLFIYLID